MPIVDESCDVQWLRRVAGPSLRRWRRHGACSCEGAMADGPDEEVAIFAQLLRRAAVIVEHHRFHRQEIDARDIVDRVVGGRGPDGEPLGRWRGPLSEAIAALMHGLR